MLLYFSLVSSFGFLVDGIIQCERWDKKARRLIGEREGVKAKCSRDMQIKCIKGTHHDQNISFSMTAFAKLPIARNCASECSTVCFHVAGKGTCTKKGNLLLFSLFSTKCLTLLPIKEVKDNKVKYLRSSAFRVQCKRNHVCSVLKLKKKIIYICYLSLQAVPEKKAWSFDSGCPTIYRWSLLWIPELPN